MPNQRKCIKCSAFLPNSGTDPHQNCPRCRGGKCSWEGSKCDFCKDWSKSVWDSLIPCPRPYSARNPATRTKKPGKSRPSPVPEMHADEHPRAIGKETPAPKGTIEKFFIKKIPKAQESFEGFCGEISKSSLKLKSLAVPLKVANYKSLPNPKLHLVEELLRKVHPDKIPYIQVVFDLVRNDFNIISKKDDVSDLSYEDWLAQSEHNEPIENSEPIEHSESIEHSKPGEGGRGEPNSPQRTVSSQKIVFDSVGNIPMECSNKEHEDKGLKHGFHAGLKHGLLRQASNLPREKGLKHGLRQASAVPREKGWKHGLPQASSRHRKKASKRELPPNDCPSRKRTKISAGDSLRGCPTNPESVAYSEVSEDRPIEEQVSGDKKLGSEGERKKDRGVRPQENNLGSIPISNQDLSEGLGELEQSQCMEPVNSEERLVTGESSYSIVQIIALKEQNSQTG